MYSGFKERKTHAIVVEKNRVRFVEASRDRIITCLDPFDTKTGTATRSTSRSHICNSVAGDPGGGKAKTRTARAGAEEPDQSCRGKTIIPQTE